MAGADHVSDCRQLEDELVYLVGLEQCLGLERLPKTSAEAAPRKQLRGAFRRYVVKVGEPVGIGAVGRREKMHNRFPRDHEGLTLRLRGVNENVVVLVAETMIERRLNKGRRKEV